MTFDPPLYLLSKTLTPVLLLLKLFILLLKYIVTLFFCLILSVSCFCCCLLVVFVAFLSIYLEQVFLRECITTPIQRCTQK